MCIRDYDHHCPWVGKCIGAANKGRFNFFVGLTPVYMVYSIVILMIASALTLEVRPKWLKCIFNNCIISMKCILRHIASYPFDITTEKNIMPLSYTCFVDGETAELLEI